MNNLKEIYAKPDGGILSTSINRCYAGIATVRKFENKECELKRMTPK